MTSFGVIVLGCLIICTSSSSDFTSSPSISVKSQNIPTIHTADEKASPNLIHLIIGGQEASKFVPYIVSIQYLTNQRKWKHLCGGSIISSSYVLTAAHCLVPLFNEAGTKPFSVLAGRNDLQSRIGSRHRIVTYTPHPQYEKKFKGYDIAVIKVHPRFKFNQKTITKIEFDSSQRVLDNIPAVFHGWGFTGFGYPEILRRGNFVTVSEETCKSLQIEDLSSTDLCTFGKNFSVGYRGDSGGPLVNKNENLQIGVCSYGIWNPHVNMSFPSVFTRVSEFSNWIKEQISK